MFAPPYSILFMAESLPLRAVHRRHIFHLGTWRRKTTEFIGVLNKKHPTVKFTGEWPKTQIIFLDVTVYLENEKIKIDLYVKPTETHLYLHSSSCTPIVLKRELLIVKRSTIIGFALILYLLIGDVMTWEDGY